MVEMLTTKKQFKLFKKFCKKWIKYFSLNDWEVHFVHEDCGGRGYCATRATGRISTIKLGKTWELFEGEKVTKKELNLVAFHEVCHLLFASMYACAFDRHMSAQPHCIPEHAIIRRLENTVFKNS